MSNRQQFQRIPSVVDTMLWTGGNTGEMEGFTGAGNFRVDHVTGKAEVYDYLHDTWVGVSVGHRVVRGVEGEFYPIAPGALAKTYHPLAETDVPE